MVPADTPVRHGDEEEKKTPKKMPGSGRLNLVIIYIYGLLYPIVVILVTVYI